MNARRIGRQSPLSGPRRRSSPEAARVRSQRHDLVLRQRSGKNIVVLVTDIDQLNDHGFNQLAYSGLLRAQRELGIRQQVFQSPSAQDYVPNLSHVRAQGR